jgi:hypothetical protein
MDRGNNKREKEQVEKRDKKETLRYLKKTSPLDFSSAA